MPADEGGLLWDGASEATVGESQAVSNSSGPLSGLEASLIVVWDSSMKTTAHAVKVRVPLDEKEEECTHIFWAS
jgi:hypothetical protein